MIKLNIQLFADNEEKNVLIQQKTASGMVDLYPLTKIENVDGLDEALKKTLQPYDSSASYVAGDIVIYGNGIYKANASATGTWDSSKWDLVATKDYTDLLNKPTIDNNNQKVKGNGVSFGANDEVDIKGSGLISVTGNATNKDITISTTAQANVLEGVQLNGTDLAISSKKSNIGVKLNGESLPVNSGAVNVQVGVSQTDSITSASVSQDSTTKAITINIPNSKGSGLAFNYNSTTGVLSLIDTNHPVGSPLSSVDLPLELLIQSGFYDSTTEQLVLVLANDTQASPSRIYIPVGDLITEYNFDSTYFSTTRVVNGQTTISSSLIGYIDLTGKTPSSYTLSDAEYANTQKNICFIKYDGRIYEKTYETSDTIEFVGFYHATPNNIVSEYRLAVIKAGHTFTVSNTGLTYTQQKIDTLLNAKVSQNEIVETLTNTYIQADPQPSANNFITNVYYTRGGTSPNYTYTLASSFASGTTYYVKAIPSVEALNTALNLKLDKADIGIIDLSSADLQTGGTLTSTQLIEAQKKVCFIKTPYILFVKKQDNEADTNILFADYNVAILTNGNVTTKSVSQGTISVVKATGVWSFSNTTLSLYEKSDVDTLLGAKLDKATAKVQLSGDVTSSETSFDTSTQKATITTTLANSGVTAGTYSAVQVNAKGIVTAGAQMIEVDSGTGTPSSSLAVGGIFYKEVTSS